MKIEKVLEEFLTLLNKGNREQAEKFIIRKAKGREDEFAEILFQIGIEIGEKNNPFAALFYFEIANKIAKSNNINEKILLNLAIAHYNYAISLEEEKRYEEAETHYKETLKINPRHIDAHNNYANLLLNKKRYKEAETHYKKALKINPEYAEAHYNYAVLLKKKKRNEEAETHYKEALRINPRNLDAHNNYAILLEEEKRYEKAKFHYIEALRINPEDPIVHHNYATLLSDLGKFKEAETHYKKALKINPEYAEAHYNYAILLQNIKEFKEAETHYKKALKINPKYAEAHHNYAVLLVDKKRNKEAETHYKKALKINPEFVETHYNYAILLRDMNRPKEAESHYKEALRINPEYAKAFGNLGILYSDQKKYPEALEYFERASHIFKEKEMFSDYKKAEALKFSIKARISWREELWSDVKKNIEEAIENLKACGMQKDAIISDIFLNLVNIDKYFIESLTPQTLLDFQERIEQIYNITVKFKNLLEESEIYEYTIFSSKFTCIKFLYEALTFQFLHFDDLDLARKTLRRDGFSKAVQSINAIENFAIELAKYKPIGLENVSKEEEIILIKKLTAMRYIDGYISADAISKIQKLEPWEKPQTIIDYVTFMTPSKKSVKVGIVQFRFKLKFIDNTPQFPPKPEDSSLIEEKFLKYLDLAIKEKLDIVCFPEFSMTPDTLKALEKKKLDDIIIIGGSYYKNKMNVCPIIHENEETSVMKIHPSKYCQFSPVHENGMVSGDRLYVFDTHAGRFIVLICEDFRYELNNVLSRVSGLDFIFVISYNPEPDRFHKIADPIPPNYPLFILQSNVSELDNDFGRSCIFGIIDDRYKGDLIKEGLKPAGSCENEVAEINGEGILIAKFNIAQKTVSKPTPLEYWTIKSIQIVKP